MIPSSHFHSKNQSMGFLGYTTTEKSSHIRKLFTIFVGSTKTIFNKFSQHFA